MGQKKKSSSPSSGGGFFSNLFTGWGTSTAKASSKPAPVREQMKPQKKLESPSYNMMSCSNGNAMMSEACHASNSQQDLSHQPNYGSVGLAAPAQACANNVDDLDYRLNQLRGLDSPGISSFTVAASHSPPSFDAIAAQTASNGLWNTSVLKTLAKCFKNGVIEDKQVQTLLRKISSNHEQLWATLLAIYVLEESYQDEESKWNLLVEKAKRALKSAGVEKPQQLLDMISIETIG